MCNEMRERETRKRWYNYNTTAKQLRHSTQSTDRRNRRTLGKLYIDHTTTLTKINSV